MKTKILSLISLSIILWTNTQAQDWAKTPIPAKLEEGKVWKLQKEHSDNFNYKGKTKAFYKKWVDNHKGGWSGPGETQFSAEHSDITKGVLVIKAGRVTDKKDKTTYCGNITSITPIIFPVYTEVNMQCSGINLSSNFWLLSPDAVNEIDVTEVYGAEEKSGQRMSTNYHIFNRSPFTDLANSPKSYVSDGQVKLKDGYHRFGLYWKSATEMEFYFDGVWVRSLNTTNDLKDPRNRFFDQALDIIINTELHSWKSKAGIRPSDEELDNDNINKMYVDWIRTYKPVTK